MISISHYLYRKSRNWAIALFAIILLPAITTAQLRDRTEHQRADQDQSQAKGKKPAKRGPRALGVVEFLPKGDARLVPVALWIDGKYYDASFYDANPTPMALQPETLYEALNYGEPTGWFTVTMPRQVNGNWIADGKWKPQTAFDAKVAEQAAKQPKPKPRSPTDDDSGPPVLRRSPSSGSPDAATASSGGNSSSSSGNNPPPAAAQDDSDRPTLKNSSPPSAADSSRPTLGPDASQAKAAPAAASLSPDENDPDRPLLHRGKPAPQSSAAASAIATPKADAGKTPPLNASAPTPKASGAPNAPQPGRAYAAISDAGVYETRSLLYPMTAPEKEERGRPMLALAIDEVRSYASKHEAVKAPAKPGAKATAKPQNFTVADYDLRAFDLDFSNSPTFVLTARVPAPPAKPATDKDLDYFVTVVARVDINGQTQKIFSSVTDNNHLDAFPRLEIIDAVDADANGRGDLLFRQHSDGGISYALYRVYPYQMVKIFEGGAGI